MADYLYSTYIYHNTTDVIGVTPATEASNTSDFETNYKSQAVKIDKVFINATTFENVKSYSNFKNMIDGVILLWSDVKYVKDDKAYVLYLIASEPL